MPILSERIVKTLRCPICHRPPHIGRYGTSGINSFYRLQCGESPTARHQITLTGPYESELKLQWETIFGKVITPEPDETVIEE